MECSLEWDRNRVFDEDTCQLFFRLLTGGIGGGGVDGIGELTVVSVDERATTRVRPSPLNTVEMLKLGSKVLGMSPHQTMQAAERLYLQG